MCSGTNKRLAAKRRGAAKWIWAALITCVAYPPAARAVTYTAANTFKLSYPGDAFGIAGSIVVGGTGLGTGWNSSNTISYYDGLLNTTDGVHHVGYIEDTVGYNDTIFHAALWTGTSTTPIDLNPTNLPNISQSTAWGESGNQQVGYGTGTGTGNYEHAMLWEGAANTAVDLHPAGYFQSELKATNGAKQVGVAIPGGTYWHAMLWSGTAESAIDLNPSGYIGSSAFGISPDGTQQSGGATAVSGGNSHATIWSGTAASAIDINPTGFSDSFAGSTNGVQQAGYAISASDGYYHPIVWSGSANSAVDLTSLLPNGMDSGAAFSIDAWGNIAGMGGFRLSGPYVGIGGYAVVWYAGDVWNWNSNSWTAGYPSRGSDVEYVSTDGVSRSVTIPRGTILGNLTVDATHSATVTLHVNGLTSNNDFIGVVGSGIVQQVGSHVVNGTLTLGSLPGSYGSYTLGSPFPLLPASLTAGVLQINCGSSFTQTSGSFTANSVQINSGSVNQSGGTFTATTILNNDILNVANSSLGTVTGTGSLTVASSFAATANSVAQNSLNLNGKLTIALNGTNTGTSIINGLSIGSGLLDLNNNAMILTYSGPSPLPAVRNWISQGFGPNHDWKGSSGITSSAAANNPAHSTALACVESSDLGLGSFAGQMFGGDAVLLKYTSFGDDNLDGHVDLNADFPLFVEGLNDSGTGWIYGDYNYDGTTDVDRDFALFLDGYQSQGGNLGVLDSTIRGDAQLSDVQKQEMLSLVPEPGGMALLLGIATLGLRRRRK